MYQWDDGTLGYFSMYDVRADPPLCGKWQETNRLTIEQCYYASRYILCEKDAIPAERNTNSVPERLRIQLSKAVNSSIPSTHIVCPSGHWTHKLLACDIRSDCWTYEDSRESSGRDAQIRTSQCQSPLSTLYKCRNGAEYVPYSLVCDHNQDCVDFSDEDFCVHPSCSGSRQFECNNREVRT